MHSTHNACARQRDPASMFRPVQAGRKREVTYAQPLQTFLNLTSHFLQPHTCTIFFLIHVSLSIFFTS